MQSIVVDGKKIAADIITTLKQKPIPRGFVAIFVSSHDTIADSFVKQKERVARDLGIDIRRYIVHTTDTSDSLRERVSQIARTKRCIGVVLQAPLPASCDIHYVANAIPPHKDIDCLSARAIGAVYQHKAHILPPAVRVIQHILTYYKKTLPDFSCVTIVGQGALVGKPLATWLLGTIPYLQICDKGFDENILQKSDLVILGTGDVGFFHDTLFSSRAWVIDFGYGVRNGTLCGDLDVRTNMSCALYTPTPGGTGPILVASLFENIYFI